MAVPQAAYRKIEVVLNNAAGTGINHKAGILQTSVAVMKDRFYLDDLVSANDATGNEGMVGVVFLGSTNYDMRSAARFGNGGLSASGRWLNDLFFTKGIVLNFLNMLRHANYATFSAIFKSAYYFNTSQYGIRHRKLGASTWNTDVHGTSIAQANQISVPRYLIRWGYAKGDTVQFEAYITNEEGPYYTVTQSAIMLSPIDEFIVEVRAVVCTSTTNRIRVWMTEDDTANLALIPEDTPSGSAPTVIFYTDPERTIRVGEGFYAGLGPQKVFKTDSTGKVMYFHRCPIGPSYIYVNLRAFANFEDGSISSVEISISDPVSFAIRVQGRCDNNPTQGNQFGKAFDLTIPIGQKKASVENFNLQRNPPNSPYYFLNVVATPTGQNLEVIYNSSI